MSAELVVVKGKDRGAFIALKKSGVHTIGRTDGSDLALKADKKVSTSHARITGMGDERYVLEDLNSTNGTFVNGERISQVPLRSGDRVKIGHTLLIFRTDTASVHLSDLNVRSPSSSDSSSSAEKDRSTASQSPEARFGAAVSSLAELLAAPGALRDQLTACLREVVAATRAGRAILFLRDADGGALGVAAALGREDIPENAPVESPALRKAAMGELATPNGESQGAAAPVRFHESVLGALYVDTPGGRTPSPGEGRFLLASASVIALALRAERLGQFATSAVEIVGLAQNPPSRRAVALAGLAQAAIRLYGPLAAQRGVELIESVGADLRVQGDEALLTRALDRLVESALVAAKGRVAIQGALSPEGVTRLTVERGGPPLSEALARELVSPEGPAADLAKALARGADGALALARAAVARSGGRLVVEPASGTVQARFTLELPTFTEQT